MAQDKEALKLALNALETADETEFWNKQKEAITAIKAALAQPAQPPLPVQEPFGYVSMYDNPIFQKEKPEIGRWETLYITPPQRPWVGLTDKQMVDAIEPLYQNRAVAEMAVKVGIDDFRAIEAKLKEKNT